MLLTSLALLTWGVTRLAVRYSRDSARGGTPRFKPPELYTPDGEVTPKVDVFSFGVVMWECITFKVSEREGLSERERESESES